MAESVLVSARVPQAKKDASKGVLASLGANTSDLINSAFDYLLERRELPTAAPPSRPSPGGVRYLFGRFDTRCRLEGRGVRWRLSLPCEGWKARAL